MMRIMRLTLIILVFVLASCEQGSSAAGTYELVSIDGNSLPYTPSDEPGASVIQGATITLNPDGTLTMTMRYSVPPDELFSLDFNGTYTVSEGSLMFEWEDGGSTPGTLDGGTLTILNDGVAFTFGR